MRLPHNATTFKTCLGQNVAQQTANRTQRQRGGFISVTSNLRSSACKIGAPAQKKRPGPRVSTSQNCERASWPRSNALARVLLLRGCPPCEQGRQALSPDCRGVGPCRATVGLIGLTLMSSVGACCRGLLDSDHVCALSSCVGLCRACRTCRACRGVGVSGTVRYCRVSGQTYVGL